MYVCMYVLIYVCVFSTCMDGDDIFRNCRDQTWGTNSLLYIGYRVFPVSKLAGARRWPPTTSSAKVKERVELYPSSSSGISWPVGGWNLPLPLPFIFTFVDGCVCVCVHLWLYAWISAHMLSASVFVRVNIHIYECIIYYFISTDFPKILMY